MMDMMVQLMCMIGMLENILCSEYHIEQATNENVLDIWCRLTSVCLRRFTPVHFEHAGASFNIGRRCAMKDGASIVQLDTMPHA